MMKNCVLCYVLWDEKVLPSLVLEVVSQTYRKEYTTKLDEYADLGILYYVIYSSRRRRKPRLEVHKLVNGKYELQAGNPVWLPEIGLGIGCDTALAVKLRLSRQLFRCN